MVGRGGDENEDHEYIMFCTNGKCVEYMQCLCNFWVCTKRKVEGVTGPSHVRDNNT